MFRPAGFFVVAVAITLAGPAAHAAEPAAPTALSPAEHARQIEAWRAQRLQRLRSDEGWLVLAGLFWLKPGDNGFGSAADNVVVLPAHSSPAHAGILTLSGSKVSVKVAEGVKVTHDGKPLSTPDLRSDVPGPPDVLALGDLRLFVIDRDGRIGIRLRDLTSARRKTFAGIDSFPIRPEYRVVATFVPHPPHTQMQVANILGGKSPMENPGKLVFTLRGQQLSLDAVLEEPDDKSLFVIFRDPTAGKETYGAGRFVYTETLPQDGHVVLDFNKAYNPPCALTPYATCPMPPPQNRLPVRIEAGEKRIAGH